MSLLGRFKGKKNSDIEDLRNDIIENISGILSSRAPIILEGIRDGSYADYSIMSLGLKNNTRFQKKYNGKFVYEEILELIRKFEPRLMDVEIGSDSHGDNQNLLEFRILGTIQFNGMEDSIQLDSYLDFGTNLFKVRKINFV